jgi:hypothetical protein
LSNPFITLPYSEGTVTIRLDHIDAMFIRPSEYRNKECGLQIYTTSTWPTIRYPTRERAEEVMRCITDEIDAMQNEHRGGPSE